MTRLSRLALVFTFAAVIGFSGMALAAHHEGGENPCNPCAGSKAENPCDEAKAENPCNPCADAKAKNPCNPCGGDADHSDH